MTSVVLHAPSKLGDQEGHHKEHGLPALHRPDSLPSGYDILPDGLWDVTREGNAVHIGAWLTVTALFKEASSQGWGKVVVIEDPDGIRHTSTLLDGDIATNWSKVLSRLLNAGYQLGDSPDCGKRLQRLLQIWRPTERKSRVNRIGVHLLPHPCFVLPNGQIIGRSDLIADTAVTTAAADMSAAGSVENWRENLGVLCLGNPLMIVAVSLAFFGPILGLVDPDMAGGFHFGGASSRGKSAVAEIAASVWGGPRFRRSWNATANGLEAMAAAHGGTLLVLDEIGEASPKVISRAIYQLANGTGRGRMTSEAGMRAQDGWALAFLSTGEIGVGQRLAGAGLEVMAGQSVRLIEIIADGRRFGAFDALHGAADGAAFADLIKRRRLATHGTAGPAFVEALFADLGTAMAQVESIAASFEEALRPKLGPAPDGQVRRVLKRCAHVAAAGELASSFGLTGWPKGAAVEALQEVFDDWLSQRDSGVLDLSTTHVVRLRAWMDVHAKEIGELGGECPTGARAWQDSEMVYFRNDLWIEIHGAAGREAAKALHAAGILIKGEERNLAAHAPRSIPGRPRVYRVKKAHLSATRTAAPGA